MVTLLFKLLNSKEFPHMTTFEIWMKFSGREFATWNKSVQLIMILTVENTSLLKGRDFIGYIF